MAISEETAARRDKANDEMARPISFDARYGSGKDRTLVLGGGGVYFVAWQVAYLNGLQKAGVALDRAEIVVGTSAGSIVASIITNGDLAKFAKRVDWLSKMPSLVAKLAPAADFYPSQLRALDMFRDADNARPETIRAIGHAALAARAAPPQAMRRSTAIAIAARGWPSAKLQLTTADCYSGERLVVTKSTNVTAVRAAAASSAVPGVFSPQRIHDRFCMDGGVSGTGTHCDLVAGSKRAIVISLGAALAESVAGMTNAVGGREAELAALAASGTEAIVRGPAEVDMTKLMDPAQVPTALAIGQEQAAKDAAEFAKFWN